MNKVLYSIHNDLDAIGILCLIRHYSYLLEDFDIWINNYEDPNYQYDELKNYNKIIYADFSPDEKCRQIIQENNIQCLIFDHHEAAVDELKNWKYNNYTYFYDNTKCGTTLFYEYYLKKVFGILTNKCIDEFCTLIETYDTWKKTSELWKKATDLNRLLYKTLDYSKSDLSKYNLFLSLIEYKFNNNIDFVFNKIEQIKIQNDINKENELFFKLTNNPSKYIKTRKDEKGRYFCVIKLNKKISAICNRLLEKYSKLDYVIALNDYDKENLGISLRSKEHINLLEYENVKGHNNAAGLTNVTQELFDNLWSSKVYCIKNKN